MKKMFGPALLGTWLAGILPDRVFSLGKKTPWYRRSWMTNAPWIGGVLMAPFAVFLLWKGVTLLRSRAGSESGQKG